MQASAESVRPPTDHKSPWWFRPVGPIVVAVVWASFEVLALTAGFDAPARDLGVDTGEMLVPIAVYAVLLGVAVQLVRRCGVPVAVVAVAGLVLVAAFSLPVSGWVRAVVVFVGGLAVAAVARHRWSSENFQRGVAALALLAAVTVSVGSAWQSGRTLRAEPTDPAPAPLWLPPFVTADEGILEIDGNAECMVRVGDLFLDPDVPGQYTWLADHVGTFVVTECAGA